MRYPSLTEDEKHWLTEPGKALAVPRRLVKSMSEYSRDAHGLYSWTDRMADLIELGTR